MRVSIHVEWGDNDLEINRVGQDLSTYSLSVNDPKRIVFLLDETIEAVKRAINAGN